MGVAQLRGELVRTCTVSPGEKLVETRQIRAQLLLFFPSLAILRLLFVVFRGGKNKSSCARIWRVSTSFSPGETVQVRTSSPPQLSDAHRDNVWLQNEMAWQLAADKSIEAQGLALAETIATRANEGAKGKDTATLDTLARVWFMQSKRDQAIALQEKAVNLAEGDEKAQSAEIARQLQERPTPQGGLTRSHMPRGSKRLLHWHGKSRKRTGYSRSGRQSGLIAAVDEFIQRIVSQVIQQN